MSENTSVDLSELFGTLQVAEEEASEGLQVFGLTWTVPTGPEYITLDQALEAGTLVITETSEQGNVPELRVINRGDTHVLLMQGEHLVGAKQNRTLNTTILVRPHSGLSVPVSCVERGRWSYESRKFDSRGTASHNRLRREVTKQVSDSYRARGKASSHQGHVWNEVDRKLYTLSADSPSMALESGYSRHAERLEQSRRRLPCPQTAHGAVFAYGGRVVALEMFDKPATLAAQWPKLLASHMLDVLELGAARPETVTRDDVQEWVKIAAATQPEAHKSPGEGTDLRIQGDTLVGSALQLDGSIVHLAIFTDRA